MSPRAPRSTACAATVPAAIEETDTHIALANRPAVDARLYGKRTPGAATPLVLHFHGGAFVAGGLDNGATVARMLAGAGAVVVSLAYPLAPASPFPQGIEVGYDVLEWVHKQRVKLAGQGARVFLAGEEAGGNLAAAVAMMSRDRAHPPLAGQILLSPMLDPCVGTASQREATDEATTRCKWADGWQQYLRCPMDAEHPYAVPGTSRRLADLAPTLVLSGADDPLRDEARTYADRLRDAGINVTYSLLPSAQGWPDALLQATPTECPCAVAVQEQIRDFFNATAQPAQPPVAALQPGRDRPGGC
ncbi:MAG: alpha/beta hydrolase [Xylophilus sp.]|nr:alpha/beta hydrolase [Burkholderiaceae bacterium]MBP8229824.1 alpha/beta hydrolase [Xylophilus sp.]